MKKKLFIPLSVLFFVMILFYSFFPTTWLIFVLPTIIYGNYNGGTVILLILAFLFCLYMVLQALLSYKIHLKENEIKTYGDMNPSWEKIQFKTSVLYKDIKSIDIVNTSKNSKDEDIHRNIVLAMRLKKYIEFTLINESKERICINFYRKKQVAKILEYININMKYHNNENTLNVEEIMKDWSNIVTYNPKKNSKNNDNENAEQQDQQENE